MGHFTLIKELHYTAGGLFTKVPCTTCDLMTNVGWPSKIWREDLAFSTHPMASIPPGSVNEYQLRLRRQRQVRFIPLRMNAGCAD